MSRSRVSLGVLFLLLLCQCDSAGTGEDSTTPPVGEPFSKIAFISNVDGLSQIFTMNPDGSDITQLTDDAGRKSHPDWSPDGRSLVFTVRAVDGTHELSLIDADGTNPRRLPNTRGEVNDPAWSPDGGRIAFSNRVDGNIDVYVIDLDGGNLTRLTTHPAIDGNPDWAPDGSRLSFESKRDTSQPDHASIYTMNADGSNQQQVFYTPELFCSSWSQEGSRIVFTSHRPPAGASEPVTDLFSINPDGTDLQRVTQGEAFDLYASYSPDGLQIAYLKAIGGDFRIYVIDADGSNERRIAGRGQVDEDPAWSPSIDPATSSRNQVSHQIRFL